MDTPLNPPFWQSEESSLFLNPRLPEEKKAFLEKAIKEQASTNSLWIKSSGTESSQYGVDKLVRLSKKAVLHAAQAVNRFYNITDKDIWLNSLPLFHIGGLSISARCFLAKAKEVRLKEWSPESCYQAIEENEVTVISLVPTQVYDLVELNKKSPPSLRLIIVGGGALDKSLYKKAREQGWPLVPSYGMTETSAMIAGADLNSLNEQTFPQAKLLPHVELKKEGSDYFLKSECLFDGYLLVSPKKTEWKERSSFFKLDDRIDYNGTYLKVLGRESELVKILGETVNLNELEKKIQKLLPEPRNIYIKAEKEERRGYRLYAHIEGKELDFNEAQFNQQVLPVERIEKVFYKPSFSRTDLGKVIRE